MKQAIILQGWYQKTDSNFYPWLRKELENKGYTVFLPDLPTIYTDLPDMAKQLAYIEENININNETVIIGHSIGCLLAMRLAEKLSFGKMILIAGWDFDDLTKEHQLFWPNKINHTKIKENVKEIYCISSDNDPYMTAFTVEAMAKRLDAKFILVHGAGHFTNDFGITEIPQMLELL